MSGDDFQQQTASYQAKRSEEMGEEELEGGSQEEEVFNDVTGTD